MTTISTQNRHRSMHNDNSFCCLDLLTLLYDKYICIYDKCTLLLCSNFKGTIMKISNLSALDQHYVKRIGIIFASIFILLEIIAKLTGTIEKIDMHFFNLYILLSLTMIAFSKEKTDDERTQIIRYFSLKMSFRLLIAGLATINFLKFKIESIYIAISSLILYLIIFYLTNYFNPDFVFKEETKNNKGGVKFIVAIMIFIGLGLLINIVGIMISSK